MDLQGKVEILIYNSETEYKKNGDCKRIYRDSYDFRQPRFLFEVNENSYVVINYKGNSLKKLLIYIQAETEYEYIEIVDTYSFSASEYPKGEWKLCYVDELLNVKYESFFKVNAFADLEDADLLKLRDVIESISPGISYDYSKLANYVVAIGDTLPNVVRLKYNLLRLKKGKIIEALNNIIDNPITNLEKNVIKGKEYKKQNSKSIFLLS